MLKIPLEMEIMRLALYLKIPISEKRDLYNLLTVYNWIYNRNYDNLFPRKTQYFASPLLRLMFTILFTFETD